MGATQEQSPWRSKSNWRERSDSGTTANNNSDAMFSSSTTKSYRQTFDSRRKRKVKAPAPSPSRAPLIGLVEMNKLEEESRKYLDTAKITDSQYFTSFNWVIRDQTKPSYILIPGKPAKWTPPAGTVQLESMCFQPFLDQNAARFACHPMEPSVVAALLRDPDIYNNLDVFACNSTIGNLLRVVRSIPNVKFRMLVEVVGKTVFFVRRENAPKERLKDVYGCHYAFRDTFMTWDPDVTGSVVHQRIMRYNFGGMSFLVRHGSDGYLPDFTDFVVPAVRDEPQPQPETQPDATGNSPTAANIVPVDLLQDLSVSEPSALSCHTSAPSPVLRCQYATGQAENLIELNDPNAESDPVHFSPIEQSECPVAFGDHPPVYQRNLFEVRTRSAGRRDHWSVRKEVLAEEVPRFWVDRNPNLMIAWHTRGRVEPTGIELIDLHHEVDAWEKSHKAELAKLVVLIRHVIDVTHQQPKKRVELVYDSNDTHYPGQLQVRMQDFDVPSTLSFRMAVLWGHSEFGEDPYGPEDYAEDLWADYADYYNAAVDD